MNTTDDFNDIAQRAKSTPEGIKITLGQVISSLGLNREASDIHAALDEALDEKDLETEHRCCAAELDAEVTLRPKQKAERKVKSDPIKRLSALKAANTPPVHVLRTDKLSKAINIMEYNGFSQLPVCNGHARNLEGYISWETIARAQAHGINSSTVVDYMSQDLVKMKLDTPLLEAIDEVYKHDFIVVVNSAKLPCGIVTTSDLSLQFIEYYKPFALIEEIEIHIRRLLDGKIPLEDLKSCLKDENRRNECNCLDDLTFGEYLWMMSVPKIWDKLRFENVDKNYFLDKLDKVRLIRNDVMHFEPGGITPQQMQELHSMADYISHLPA